MSVAAPGRERRLPQGRVLDDPAPSRNRVGRAPRSARRRVFRDANGGRWAYAQGTSFAAPIAAGVAAVVWQVEPRLASEQVADVIGRSARQTLPGARWNEFTGTGIVDGEQAAALARTYDIRAPTRAAPYAPAPRPPVRVRMRRSRDRTDHGRELAGRVRYALLTTRDDGRLRLRRAARAARRSARTDVRSAPGGERGRRKRLRRQRQLRHQAARPLQPRAKLGLQVAHRVHRRPVDARLEVQVVAEAVAGAAD